MSDWLECDGANTYPVNLVRRQTSENKIIELESELALERSRSLKLKEALHEVAWSFKMTDDERIDRARQALAEYESVE
jgi:hypothetical protein